jgi:uncharacterized RDD family membrane protein YckC
MGREATTRTDPGWYNAQGDPQGTTRYWDGERWIGDPVHTPVASSAGGNFGLRAHVNLASPGWRLGARLIDLVIAVIFGLALLIPVITDVINNFDALGPSPSDAQVERVVTDAFSDNVILLLALGVIGGLSDFIWVGLFGGTPGKLILGLRVARSDNGAHPPGWSKAGLRGVNRLVSFVPIVGSLIVLLVGLASLIMLFSDGQHRTVMDRIASTVVIKK